MVGRVPTESRRAHGAHIAVTQRGEAYEFLDRTTATCRVSSQRPDDGEPPPVWIFTLEHDDGVWAIRWIVMGD